MDKFSSIESFRHTLKGVQLYCQARAQLPPVYDYIGTVKLHGTNAGIRLTPSGKLVAQSRNRILAVDNDNYGFAQFVAERESEIREIFAQLQPVTNSDSDVTLYGELVGKGIQSNVSVSQLDLHFVIFNLKVDGEYNPLLYPLPDYLKNNNVGIYNIFQIPHYEVTVDFGDPQLALDKINELTQQVEDNCPWGAYRGVSGVGEGIVWVPKQHPNISDLWFKTKGGKHSGKVKSKGIKATVSPEKANTIRECIALVLPEWRLSQGIDSLKEIHGELTHKQIGEYIKWVNQDIIKEELDTVIQNGLEWGDVAKVVSTHARDYIINYLENDFT